MTDKRRKPYQIDNVRDETRNKIAAYKALRGFKTLAEALDEIANIALNHLQEQLEQTKSLPGIPMERPHASTDGITAEQIGESVKQ